MTTNIDSALVAYIDNHPGLAACKDQQYVYQYANPAYASLLGLSSPQDLVGRTVLEVLGDAAACAQEFDDQDRQVMSSGQVLKILNIYPFSEGHWSVYLCTKRPWLDVDNDIIGTIGEAIDITDAYTTALSMQFSQFTGQSRNSLTLSETGIVSHSNGGVSLSPRESQVLSLILRGKTAKLAAEVLNISFRTVEQHLELIKLKFGVRNKVELIETAIERGYLNHIPVSIGDQLRLCVSSGFPFV